jgi:hypothetical protein
MGDEDKERLSLLLAFERETLQGDFRTYFSDKRENFHTTIRNFPQLWECFSLLDDIWCREFADTERLADQIQIVPAMLFRDAHARFRVSMELAFSCCLNEALNALRFGIEAVYHACKLLKNPDLETARVWLESGLDDDAARKAFRQTFDDDKRASFEECGLGNLYEYWAHFSNLSHSNMKAMSVRLISPDKNRLEVHYFVRDAKVISGSIFWILRAACEMEQALYTKFESRLRFDNFLEQKRARLSEKRGLVRRDLIKRFNWTPPN